MLKLEAYQVCSRDDCPYRMGCWGANKDRNNDFECSLVDSDTGVINENAFRSQHDKTGRMKILLG